MNDQLHARILAQKVKHILTMPVTQDRIQIAFMHFRAICDYLDQGGCWQDLDLETVGLDPDITETDFVRSCSQAWGFARQAKRSDSNNPDKVMEFGITAAPNMIRETPIKRQPETGKKVISSDSKQTISESKLEPEKLIEELIATWRYWQQLDHTRGENQEKAMQLLSKLQKLFTEVKRQMNSPEKKITPQILMAKGFFQRDYFALVDVLKIKQISN